MNLDQNRRRKIGLTILFGVVALLLADFGREFIASDLCLDAGHVYDYGKGICRDDVIHLPYVSYLARNLFLMAASGILGLIGLWFVAIDRK